MARIVVVGAGICGSAAALVLARDGHGVTVVDRDPDPLPDTAEQAWEAWERRSVGQFRMAHLMLARGSAVLRAELPDVAAELERHGGLALNVVDAALSRTGGERRADDDRFGTVTARRPTLEWVLARALEAEPGVVVRRGRVVEGLRDGAAALAGVPHVSGVCLDGGDEVPADLVVDATGRRGPTPRWLAALGTRPPQEQAEDSGFAYYGRFYRSEDGRLPAVRAPLLAPLGSISLLSIPSDNGTWSITLYAGADDAPMRRLRDPEVFERVVGACPAHAHWLDGTPIAEVRSMTGVVDRSRTLVVDGRPVVTGMVPLADARSCTNPSLGRGMSLGLAHVALLRATVRASLDDPVELVAAFEAATRAELDPWHEATLQLDRARAGEMRALAQGREPEPSPVLAISAALATAATYDATALRQFAAVQNCLALPSEVFAAEGALEHVLAVTAESPPAVVPGPDRRQLLELVA